LYYDSGYASDNLPSRGANGSFFWPLRWLVNAPLNKGGDANATNGGWIIQHVVANFDVRDKAKPGVKISDFINKDGVPFDSL